MKTKIKTLSYVLGIFLIFLIGGCQYGVNGDLDLEESGEIASKLGSIDQKFDGDILVFKSIDEYRFIAENQEQQEEFIHNLRVQRNYDSSVSTGFKISGNEFFSDNYDFLENILNSDGIVQIGDYVYRIDLDNELVYVMSNVASKETILNPERNLKGLMIFSINDNVLDLIESGSKGTVNTENSAIFCGGGCDAYKNLTRTIDLGNTNEVQSEVNYIKAGIYFELSHYIYSYYASTPSGLDVNNGNTPPAPLTSYSARYRPNCKNSDEVVLNVVNIEMKYKSREAGGFFVGSFRYKFKDSLYKSTRGLRKISFTPTYSTRGVNFSGATINCI